MFKIYMRGMAKWTSGFGRYLDLMAGVTFLFLAYSWQSPISAALGAFGVLSFAIDINGRFQRWTMRSVLARAGAR